MLKCPSQAMVSEDTSYGRSDNMTATLGFECYHMGPTAALKEMSPISLHLKSHRRKKWPPPSWDIPQRAGLCKAA